MAVDGEATVAWLTGGALTHVPERRAPHVRVPAPVTSRTDLAPSSHLNFRAVVAASSLEAPTVADRPDSLRTAFLGGVPLANVHSRSIPRSFYYPGA
ncbi:hypothetical protein DMJ13_14200 [halophilic archaeon]|nr:hypothetical protein DMJ13_14200 [halophilic archaeon]